MGNFTLSEAITFQALAIMEALTEYATAQSATFCTLLLSVIFKKKVFPTTVTLGLQDLYRIILCNLLEIIMENWNSKVKLLPREDKYVCFKHLYYIHPRVAKIHQELSENLSTLGLKKKHKSQESERRFQTSL